MPTLRGPVVDDARVLSTQDAAALSVRLRQLRAETGVQLVVATLPSLDGEPIEAVSLKLCESWRLGRRGEDDGLLLLVAPNERQGRIEVGYGLEDVLPDVLAHRLLAAAIADHKGLNSEAVLALSDVLDKRIRAHKDRLAPVAAKQAVPESPAWVAAYGSLACVLLLVFVAAWFTLGRRRMQAQPFRPLRPAPGSRGRVRAGGGMGLWNLFSLLSLLGRSRGGRRDDDERGPDDRGGGGTFGGGGSSGRW